MHLNSYWGSATAVRLLIRSAAGRSSGNVTTKNGQKTAERGGPGGKQLSDPPQGGFGVEAEADLHRRIQQPRMSELMHGKLPTLSVERLSLYADLLRAQAEVRLKAK